MRRKARRVGFQSGRGQCAGSDNCAGVVSLAVFSSANELHEPGRLESLRKRADASRRAGCISEVPISPFRQGLFPAKRNTRAFLDGAVLPLHSGWKQPNHSWGDSSSAVAASARRSGACAKLDGGILRRRPGFAASPPFRWKTGRAGVGATATDCAERSLIARLTL